MTKYLKIKQIADHLRVTPQTVTNLIRDGALTATRVGRQWRVHPDSLSKFIHDNATPTYLAYEAMIQKEPA